MKDKILDSALIEFSEKPYNEASINSIYKRAEISKGIIYHYFKNKDDLVLTCIKMFFDDLLKHLNTNFFVDKGNVNTSLNEYFIVRNEFFNNYPLYLNFYYNITNNPIDHLYEEIKVLRADFDKLNEEYLLALLSNLDLSSEINLEDAVLNFKMLQEFIDIRYQVLSSTGDREEHIKRWLNIFLYGIVKRREE